MKRARVATAAALVAALALTGCAGRAQAPEESPQPSRAGVSAPPHAAAATVPPVDVLAGTEIRTADGRRISLAWAGPGAQVVRVPAGWLVSRYGEAGADLWLMHDDGRHEEILGGVEAFAVATDGQRLAYRQGDRLVVAELTEAGATEIAGTQRIGRFLPFLLYRQVVVLAYSQTGGEMETFDTWRWSDGPYVPTPVSPFVAGDLAVVAGGLPDENGMLGMASSDCLAVFDVGSLAVTRRACQLRMLIGKPTVSPDGRWLLVRLLRDPAAGVRASDNDIGVLDLHRVFDDPGIVGIWPDAPLSSVDVSLCAWPDPVTALCAADGGLVRLRMERSGELEFLPLAGLPSTAQVASMVLPVEDLRRR